MDRYHTGPYVKLNLVGGFGSQGSSTNPLQGIGSSPCNAHSKERGKEQGSPPPSFVCIHVYIHVSMYTWVHTGGAGDNKKNHRHHHDDADRPTCHTSRDVRESTGRQAGETVSPPWCNAANFAGGDRHLTVILTLLRIVALRSAGSQKQVRMSAWHVSACNSIVVDILE